MVFWILLPIALSLVSFVGTWTVYGLAVTYKHVCPLIEWSGTNSCRGNETENCCWVPTVSSSGRCAPESSLFTATINAASFLFLLFCMCHHAHILERNASHSMLSKLAFVFGVVSAAGAFAAGNCNPGYLTLLHFFGAAVSFLSLCFYTVLLTALTVRCVLTGYEKLLYPLRIVLTITQIIETICYAILFVQDSYLCNHLSAVCEWMLTINTEMFELSYTVEFCFFSSSMLSNLLKKREEEKSLILS